MAAIHSRAEPTGRRPVVIARIRCPHGGLLVRAGRLTPYDFELVAADARRTGARLDVVVRRGTASDDDVVASPVPDPPIGHGGAGPPRAARPVRREVACTRRGATV